MKYLFTGKSLEEFRKYIDPDTLYIFDFDGTLCPIVNDPKKAKISRATLSLIKSLSDKACVGIISGRSSADLKRRLGFSARYIYGNHGLEGPFSSLRELRTSKQICTKWYHELKSDWNFERCVRMENKDVTLALHYRGCGDEIGVQKEILARCKQLTTPPRIVLGKKVVNLIPTAKYHKGTAIRKLMKNARFKKALYIGDDDTDEDIFRIVRPRLFSIRVGEDKESDAEYFIQNQAQVKRLIKAILEAIK